MIIHLFVQGHNKFEFVFLVHGFPVGKMIAGVAANENAEAGCNGLQLLGMTNIVSKPAMSRFSGFGNLLDLRV
jgi:hypothetical protein